MGFEQVYVLIHYSAWLR